MGEGNREGNREMPARLRIGYQDVAIVTEKSSLGESYGYYDSQAATIKINVDHTPTENANTLIHEILHAIWHTYGLTIAYPDKDRHEHIVTTMANAMTAMFRDNPFLLEWVHGQLVPAGETPHAA